MPGNRSQHPSAPAVALPGNVAPTAHPTTARPRMPPILSYPSIPISASRPISVRISPRGAFHFRGESTQEPHLRWILSTGGRRWKETHGNKGAEHWHFWVFDEALCSVIIHILFRCMFMITVGLAVGLVFFSVGRTAFIVYRPRACRRFNVLLVTALK